MTAALPIFVNQRLGERKEREERPSLVTTAHGTPTMKRWSFDVRSCDQARPPTSMCFKAAWNLRSQIKQRSLQRFAEDFAFGVHGNIPVSILVVSRQKGEAQ